MVLIFACVETNREKTMAKSSLTIAVALLFYLPVLSQQNDKALSFTSRYKKSDTSQIRLLLDRGKNFENINPDSSTYYYKKATAIAYALKQQQLLLKCMAQHIALLNNEAKFEDAFTLAQEHIDMSNQLGYPAVQLQAYNEAANEYEYLGNYEPATENYLKSLKLAAQIGDKKMERKINNNLASVFIALKDYVTGYNYSLKAYRMAAKDNDTVTIRNCLVNIGFTELPQKKFNRHYNILMRQKKIGYGIPCIGRIDLQIIPELND